MKLRAFIKMYVHFIPKLIKYLNISLPSNNGLASTTITSNFLPALCASDKIFLIKDELKITESM